MQLQLAKIIPGRGARFGTGAKTETHSKNSP